MFAANFDYYRPATLADAIAHLAEDDTRAIAGGHSLLPIMKLRLAQPTALVDIGRLEELKGIKQDGGTITVGALTTHAELASSRVVRDGCPILAEAAGMIGDPAVRNRGTIGGNVAHSDPASDLPTVLTALNARINVRGPGGERRIAAPGFFEGLMQTALKDGEIITSIEVPARHAGQGMAYTKFSHPASRYSVLGVAVLVTRTGDNCSAAGIAIGGLVPRPVTANSVEGSLVGRNLSDQVLDDAAKSALDDLDDDELIGDIFASAEYRKAMVPVYLRRALATAAARAT